MQLKLIFDKPKKEKVIKSKLPELSKHEKFKISVQNYFKLTVHQRINLRTWMKYCSLRIFHEQVDCTESWIKRFDYHYEYAWRRGHSKCDDNLQYGINQY